MGTSSGSVLLAAGVLDCFGHVSTGFFFVVTDSYLGLKAMFESSDDVLCECLDSL